MINLGIVCIVKTDNDLKETTKNSSKQFEYIGYNRCVGLLDGNEWEKWEDKNGYIKIVTERIKLKSGRKVILTKFKKFNNLEIKIFIYQKLI